MTELQQIGTFVAKELNNYSKKYNITTSEYKTGNKRNSKIIYGMEYDIDGLPNNDTKSIKINDYDSSFTYWIDLSNSYAYDDTNKITIPLIYDNVKILLNDGNINIITTDDLSSFTVVKVVLNYFK